ncbi:hypothetical protein D3C72_1868830 [compost metagenome]
MMHAVGREPVQLLNLDLHMFDGATAHVFELQGVRLLGTFVAHGTDQARSTAAGQREYRQKIRLVQIHMQFAIERRAAGLDVGDIEHLLVGTAGKTGVEGLAHDRTGAVATGQVAGLTGFLLTVGQAQRGADAVIGLLETFEFGVAFHREAEGLQALDQ